MKATEDFLIIVNKDGVRIPYKEGDPKKDLTVIKVPKGSEIPKKHIQQIVDRNIELVDVEYIEKVPQLPPELSRLPEPPKPMKIEKRKYSQDSLNKVYNEKGFSALKKIGAEFGVTDRSSRKIITEILRAQEERQRKG